jgi:hypothetical protein
MPQHELLNSPERSLLCLTALALNPYGPQKFECIL